MLDIKKLLDIDYNKLLLSKKFWLVSSLIVVIFISIINASIITFNNYIIYAGKDNKDTLDEINMQIIELDAEIVEVKQLDLLPSFTTQIEYAKKYFTVYGLTMTKTSTSLVNQQNIVVKGSLKNILLAIYDIIDSKLLIKFGKILIDGDNATLHLIIYGNKDI